MDVDFNFRLRGKMRAATVVTLVNVAILLVCKHFGLI